MGWVAGRAYKVGVGSVSSPQRVMEKGGYEGEFLTLTTHGGEMTHWAGGEPARVKRNGRKVYAARWV